MAELAMRSLACPACGGQMSAPDRGVARCGFCSSQVLVYESGVRKVGVCSGAASDLLEAAAGAGCDLFVTGELAERAGDLARELQITLVAAGHYATEVHGPTRLADELRMTFPSLSVHFVGVPSPL